ncbi:MAG: hypothetical protein M3Y67_04765 [Pseudomonadota bacterium]|nr:hypothetical protein [Pseudomonadota bacterium]
MRSLAAALLLALGLAGCSTPALQSSPQPAPQSPPYQSAPQSTSALSDAAVGRGIAQPEPRPCPAGVAAGTLCLAGTDTAGAHYWLAVPAPWNGMLVLHAHGGPELGAPSSARTEQDLKRWSVWSRAGYAWAGTSFRQGGVEVRAAAADTERLRHIFSAVIGVPTRTLLHGQSWGASVAAIAAETYTQRDSSGRPPYDAVLLTSGVLGGGSRSYDFRLDLRVVYEALCANHPRPDEAPYPLWQGLPPGATLTAAELRARVDACTGIDQPAAQRTEAQRRRLQTLLDVILIPERSLVGHLNWATFHFRDVVFNRLGGRNPFGNEGVRYTGSADDTALNAAVARYRADPAAVAAFAADTDPHGRIAVPVLTVHAIDDPVAFVELESTWLETMREAGTDGNLVQLFTDDHDHSYLSDAAYVAAMRALLRWLENGERPTPQSVAAACPEVAAAFDPARGCRFMPQYRPAPLASRVPTRSK